MGFHPSHLLILLPLLSMPGWRLSLSSLRSPVVNSVHPPRSDEANRGMSNIDVQIDFPRVCVPNFCAERVWRKNLRANFVPHESLWCQAPPAHVHNSNGNNSAGNLLAARLSVQSCNHSRVWRAPSDLGNKASGDLFHGARRPKRSLVDSCLNLQSRTQAQITTSTPKMFAHAVTSTYY